MINKRALADELTEAFIRYQYQLENPFPDPPTAPVDMMIWKYHTDAIFHRKVQSLVAGVLSIVDKHTDDGEALQ